MLYKISRKLLLITDALGSVIICYLMRNAGVRIGQKVKCYGVPILSIFKGSQIKIGSDTLLRSKSRGNAVGINHPVVLTTLASSACIEIGSHVGMSGGAISYWVRIQLLLIMICIQ